MPRRENCTHKTAKELFLEQAAAFFDDLKTTAENAPYGQFFNYAEAFSVQQGQKLLLQNLENLTQEGIDEFEKKKETTLCPQCQTKKRHRGYRWKERMSALGIVKIKRRYDECMPCRLPGHVADEPFGLEGRYSKGIRRLAVYAGTDNAFRKGSEALKEFLGLELCPNTVRELCQQEAPKMQEWRQQSSEIQKDFLDAPGNVEITMDGTCVNTTCGYREVKVAIVSKRELGKGVLPKQWSKRKLPDIGACVAFAAVEKKDRFQKRFRHWRRRLRLGSTGDISALGDGAAWIWNIVRSEFGKVRECLDIYHALEHLSDTGKVLYGEETDAYKQWYEEVKLELLQGGFGGMEKRLDGLLLEKKKRREKESLRNLKKYLSSQRERLNYRERLAEGRVIGSGQVEGACKNLIGKRLKQTGAQWKVRRLNRMTILCAVRYCDQWKNYWANAK